MNKEQGKALLEIARKTIELWVTKKEEFKPENYPDKFKEKLGVFVSLHTYPEKDLRGCIGYSESVFPLIGGLVKVAISATQDPRFPELKKDELDKIIIEVSVLTKPELIEVKEPKEYLEKIVPKKDGLILEKGMHAGLFLPVVWEQLPEKEDFLNQLCLKAGLNPGDWLDPGVKLYKFYTEIFSEKEPNGEIASV